MTIFYKIFIALLVSAPIYTMFYSPKLYFKNLHSSKSYSKNYFDKIPDEVLIFILKKTINNTVNKLYLNKKDIKIHGLFQTSTLFTIIQELKLQLRTLSLVNKRFNSNITDKDINKFINQKIEELCSWLTIELSQAEKEQILIKALVQNNENVACIIVKSGIEPNITVSIDIRAKMPLIILATKLNFVKLIKLLLSENLLMTGIANVNAKDEYRNTALIIAAQNGHKKILKLLIDCPQKQREKDKALLWAVYCDHKHIIKLLIKNGANVNFKTKDGYNSLTFALFKSHKEIENLLIRFGAIFSYNDSIAEIALIKSKIYDNKTLDLILKLNLQRNLVNLEDPIDFNNNTVLMLMAKDGQKKILHLLLQHGAQFNSKNNLEQTPLILASREGHLGIVKILVRLYRCQIDAMDKFGETALYKSLEKGHLDIAEFLILNGAKNICNEYGKSPLSIAIKNKYLNILALLKQTN